MYARICRPEHGVEGGGELGIPVADQESGTPVRVLHLPDPVTGLLGDPGGRGMLRATGDEHSPGLQLDEEQHEQGLQPERLDREEITSEHACGVGAEKGVPG